MILERGLLEMEYMEVTPSQVENYECASPPMWNDKISSCVFKVIKVDEITNGSIKPHPEIK